MNCLSLQKIFDSIFFTQQSGKIIILFATNRKFEGHLNMIGESYWWDQTFYQIV